MNNQTTQREIRIVITDVDGTVLDSVCLDIGPEIKAIEYRPSTTAWDASGRHESLKV